MIVMATYGSLRALLCSSLFISRIIRLSAQSCSSLLWNAGAEDIVHLYQEYLFPTCVHCVTNWTNFGSWWGKTETFLQLRFYASQRLWKLCGSIPHSAVQLAGFQLLRADHDTEPVKRRVEVSVFIQTLARAMILQHGSPDLESFFNKCKAFYLPEFVSFIEVDVYIPPQDKVQDARHMLANQILWVEWTTLVIVLDNLSSQPQPPQIRKMYYMPDENTWITVKLQSAVHIAPALHWTTLTTSWPTWFFHTGRN